MNTPSDFDPFWPVVIGLVVAVLLLVSHPQVIMDIVRLMDAGVR